MKNPDTRSRLVEEIKEVVTQKYPNEAKNLDLGDEHILKLLDFLSGRISYASDVVDVNLAFLWVLPSLDAKTVAENFDADKLIKALENVDFEHDKILQALRDFSKNNDIKFKALMVSLRALLTGLPQGPKVAEMMEILGKETTFYRIRRVNHIDKTTFSSKRA